MASTRTRRKRITAVVAVAVVTLVAFASLGGVGLAQSAVGLAQYQYGKKVTICHKGKNTIRISVRAWPAHKRHGDTQGACIAGAKKKQGKKGAQGGNRSEHAGASTEKHDNNSTGHGNSQGKGNKK
jgi:hypothetical protein